MAPFRPSNLNTRLVSNTGGNAGVIGPRTCPFSAIALGCRCDNTDKCGRYNISESYCKAKCPQVDCKGILVCCGPSTTKWFIAPSCTELSRSWYSRADLTTVTNACMGSCGWFLPLCDQLFNAGYCCKGYWDCYQSLDYVSCSGHFNHYAWNVNFSTGTICLCPKGNSYCMRAFRCTVS